jgi:hypothetical protein
MEKRGEKLNKLKELSMGELMDLGGTRVVDKTKNSSEIKALTSKQMYDSYDIYSKIKNQAFKDSLAWDKEDRTLRKLKYEKSNELRDKLLSFGGNDACIIEPEEDIENILNYGQFWLGKSAISKKGKPNQCHYNSCNLWDSSDNASKTRICTGYALSSDGLWRQHSWLVLFKANSNAIVETTVKRVAYFGFIMDEETCKEFYTQNT